MWMAPSSSITWSMAASTAVIVGDVEGDEEGLRCRSRLRDLRAVGEWEGRRWRSSRRLRRGPGPSPGPFPKRLPPRLRRARRSPCSSPLFDPLSTRSRCRRRGLPRPPSAVRYLHSDRRVYAITGPRSGGRPVARRPRLLPPSPRAPRRPLARARARAGRPPRVAQHQAHLGALPVQRARIVARPRLLHQALGPRKGVEQLFTSAPAPRSSRSAAARTRWASTP